MDYLRYFRQIFFRYALRRLFAGATLCCLMLAAAAILRFDLPIFITDVISLSAYKYDADISSPACVPPERRVITESESHVV